MCYVVCEVVVGNFWCVLWWIYVWVCEWGEWGVDVDEFKVVECCKRFVWVCWVCLDFLCWVCGVGEWVWCWGGWNVWVCVWGVCVVGGREMVKRDVEGGCGGEFEFVIARVRDVGDVFMFILWRVVCVCLSGDEVRWIRSGLIEVRCWGVGSGGRCVIDGERVARAV